MRKRISSVLAGLLAALLLWGLAPVTAEAAGASFSGSGSVRAGDSVTVTFTVSGDNVKDTMKVDADGHVTSYMADVDTDPAYTGDTEVVENGFFNESAKRSAPYFDLSIDGITLLDVAF